MQTLLADNVLKSSQERHLNFPMLNLNTKLSVSHQVIKLTLSVLTFLTTWLKFLLIVYSFENQKLE